MSDDDLEVSRKLGEISEVMADGYLFFKMRCLVEEWQKQADAGNLTAQEMMKTINIFHRLCLVIQNQK